jgi:hypothetical protein
MKPNWLQLGQLLKMNNSEVDALCEAKKLTGKWDDEDILNIKTIYEVYNGLDKK